VPVAGEAETLVCKNLGIIQDGQLVTQQVLDEFSEKFKNAASSDTIAALRLLFKLDEPQDLAVEAVLLSRGGAEALEQFDQDGETQVPDA
jgi:ABC-type multidrug transport system ATPase subunit